MTPGVGVGGHCIPIDPHFFVQDTKAGKLIRLARTINNERPEVFIHKHSDELRKVSRLHFGVAYKPGVDDCRVPSFRVMEILEQMGKEVRMRSIIKGSEYFENYISDIADWLSTILLFASMISSKIFIRKRN